MAERLRFFAGMDDKALGASVLFFNVSITEIFNELIQNARRAGATRLDVSELTTEQGPAVLVADDGRGVREPRKLTAFAESDWGARIMDRERPTGVGLFCLAMRGTVISSRRPDRKQGWRMTLIPEHWDRSNSPSTSSG